MADEVEVCTRVESLTDRVFGRRLWISVGLNLCLALACCALAGYFGHDASLSVKQFFSSTAGWGLVATAAVSVAVAAVGFFDVRATRRRAEEELKGTVVGCVQHVYRRIPRLLETSIDNRNAAMESEAEVVASALRLSSDRSAAANAVGAYLLLAPQGDWPSPFRKPHFTVSLLGTERTYPEAAARYLRRALELRPETAQRWSALATAEEWIDNSPWERNDSLKPQAGAWLKAADLILDDRLKSGVFDLAHSLLFVPRWHETYRPAFEGYPLGSGQYEVSVIAFGRSGEGNAHDSLVASLARESLEADLSEGDSTVKWFRAYSFNSALGSLGRTSGPIRDLVAEYRARIDRIFRQWRSRDEAERATRDKELQDLLSSVNETIADALESLNDGSTGGTGTEDRTDDTGLP